MLTKTGAIPITNADKYLFFKLICLAHLNPLCTTIIKHKIAYTTFPTTTDHANAGRFSFLKITKAPITERLMVTPTNVSRENSLTICPYAFNSPETPIGITESITILSNCTVTSVISALKPGANTVTTNLAKTSVMEEIRMHTITISPKTLALYSFTSLTFSCFSFNTL